jgi:2,4-dienoyl-CoA reductase-like NADH-dependent reductase (Old Yellow Enzyme family)
MMNRGNYQVFSRGSIAKLDLKNRLVRSATYEASMTRSGRLTAAMLKRYRELAEGGVGLIIAGHMAVAREGKAMSKQICLWDDSFTGEMAKLVDEVHGSGDGCKIAAQLSHGGRQVLQDNMRSKAVGPTAMSSPVLRKKARELSTSEVEELVKSFADGVARAQAAGFDGVQLHAAHGWLLSSFLSPYTNRRTDRYGGSLAKRVNMVREIVSEARGKVGDFPILAKLNCDDFVPGGISRESFPELAKELENAGIDALEVSGGMWDCLARSEQELGFYPMPIPEARTHINDAVKQSYFAPYTDELDLDIPVILVGGNRNVERLEEIMGGGKVQFFALARPLLCQPDLPLRWLEGRASGSACESCNSCILMAKFARTSCPKNINRTLHKILKASYPHTWEPVFK